MILRPEVLLALVMDVPLASRAARSVTGDPRSESLEIEGVPAQLVVPAGKGPWPAWVFITGAHPLRRREPVVQRVAEALARTGYLAVVPDLPGLGLGQVTRDTVEAARAVGVAVAERPDVRNGRIALCGASSGASLALLTAADPRLAEHITVVVAITPFADLEEIARLATTGSYEQDGAFASYPVASLLRRAVARSMICGLPATQERDTLLDAVGDIDEPDIDSLDCLAPFDTDALDSDARCVIRLLTNRDPARYPELYAALPTPVRASLAAVSPLAAAPHVIAPVELAVPPADLYFPRGEALALTRALPNVRLTVTGTLDHTRPMLSRGKFADLLKLRGFVVRALRAAAA